MKHLLLMSVLVSCVSTPVWATSYQITNLGSDAAYTSFLQYRSDDGLQNQNVFTNHFHVNQPITFEPAFSGGTFSVWVVDTQTRIALDSDWVKQEGTTFLVDDGAPVDRDFNDFRFVLHKIGAGGQSATTDKAGVSSVVTPEPITLALWGTGIVLLLVFRWLNRQSPWGV